VRKRRINTSSTYGEGGSGDGPGFVRCLADVGGRSSILT
jgi:hypothetical protein